MRLTDEELNMACLAPDDDADPYPASLVRRLAHELRERRAQDLTRIEQSALRFARSVIEAHLHTDSVPAYAESSQDALAVLDRLLNQGAK